MGGQFGDNHAPCLPTCPCPGRRYRPLRLPRPRPPPPRPPTTWYCPTPRWTVRRPSPRPSWMPCCPCCACSSATARTLTAPFPHMNGCWPPPGGCPPAPRPGPPSTPRWASPMPGSPPATCTPGPTRCAWTTRQSCNSPWTKPRPCAPCWPPGGRKTACSWKCSPLCCGASAARRWLIYAPHR